MPRLKAAMQEATERTSKRKFSLAATGGTNPDFYRNFDAGQDKRLSANVYLGIVHALNAHPYDFLIDRPAEKPCLHSFQSETIEKFLEVALPALLESRAREETIQKAAHEISAALEVLALDPDRERRLDVVASLVDRVAIALGGHAPGKGRPKPDTPDHTQRSA